MPPDRLRSIVPMFGGGTRYVETLDAILAFVEAHQPTSDELVGWHRGSFQNVSSRDSIMRRVSYLQQVGFLPGIDWQTLVLCARSKIISYRQLHQLDQEQNELF